MESVSIIAAYRRPTAGPTYPEHAVRLPVSKTTLANVYIPILGVIRYENLRSTGLTSASFLLG